MAGVETGSCKEGKAEEETGSICRLAQAELTSRLTPHKHHIKVLQAKPDWSWKISVQEKTNPRVRAQVEASIFWFVALN